MIKLKSFSRSLLLNFIGENVCQEKVTKYFASDKNFPR